MATLAPNLPAQGDPEYLRYSKPISSVEGDKSGYYLGKGLGEALQEGASNADKLVGKIAEDTAYEEGQKKQAEMEKAVDPLYRQVVLGENTNSSTTPGPPKDLTPPSLIANKDLPPEVTNGTKQAASLNERFKNGKITQTDYDSEIDKLAKDLNSRFPAWRNEIGRGLSRATGRDNANLSIADKIRDINNIYGQLGQEKNKVTNEILSSKWSDPAVGQKLYDDFVNGRINASQAMFQVFRQRATDANTERALKMHEMNKAGREENKWNTESDAIKVANAVQEDWWQKYEVTAGFGSPRDLEKKLIDLANNPNDPQAQALAQQYALAVPMFRRDLRKRLIGMADSLGGIGAVDQLVDHYAKPYEDMVSMLSDPTKVGSVLYGARHIAEATQRQMEGIISQSEFGRQMQGLKALNSLDSVSADLMRAQLMGNRKDFGEQLGKLSEQFKLKAMGVDPNDRRPPIAAEAIQHAHDFNPNPKQMEDYIDFLTKIKDKGFPDDVAKNIAYAYYRPENMGLVGLWSSKQMDPRSGKPISGQINVLQRMADKDVLDRIKSLGDPKLNGYVKDFLEKTISLNVFPDLTKDTEQLVKAAEDRLGYDDEHQRFYMAPRKPGDNLRSNSFVQNTIHRLNYVAEVSNNLADFVGAKDKNGYLIGLLSANNPNLFSREVKGFPAEINKAIANQALIRKQEAEKKAKAQEDMKTP